MTAPVNPPPGGDGHTGPAGGRRGDKSPVIRIAGPADAAALAALRRAWTAEQHGPVADEGFEARFRDWYERESARRVSWLAEARGEMTGMMNLVDFERMPQPGRDPGSWGYLANSFVLAAHRNQGIGSLLLRALLAHADDHGYVRVVLRPSERAVPFYQRAGFTGDTGFLVRHARPADRDERELRESAAAVVVAQNRGRVAEAQAVRGDPSQARVGARGGQYKVEPPLADVGLQLPQGRRRDRASEPADG
jgi:GNAT superfamily N-acetyltransferase